MLPVLFSLPLPEALCEEQGGLRPERGVVLGGGGDAQLENGHGLGAQAAVPDKNSVKIKGFNSH